MSRRFGHETPPCPVALPAAAQASVALGGSNPVVPVIMLGQIHAALLPSSIGSLDCIEDDEPVAIHPTDQEHSFASAFFTRTYPKFATAWAPAAAELAAAGIHVPMFGDSDVATARAHLLEGHARPQADHAILAARFGERRWRARRRCAISPGSSILPAAAGHPRERGHRDPAQDKNTWIQCLNLFRSQNPGCYVSGKL